MRPQRFPSTILGRSARVLSVICLFLLAGLASACAEGVAGSYNLLTAVERRVNRAAERFPAYSEAKQQALLDASATRPEYNAAAGAWREKRELGVRAIEGTHATVKLARGGIADVRAGLRNAKELSTWIGPALRAAQNLFPLLEALGWREDAQ